MTARELFELEPKRTTKDPESVFAIRHPEGGEMLMCFADFYFFPEFQKANWEVTKEHFTSEEIEQWKAARNNR